MSSIIVSSSSSTDEARPLLTMKRHRKPTQHVLVRDPAPNGGYGWIVVAAAFMLNLIGDGVGYSFGLFFDPLLGHFRGASASQVALANSLMNAGSMGAGPIVSALINKYGCRPVVIHGALIWSSALYVSTLVADIRLFQLIYGVAGGIGFCMISLPSIISVGHYFNTRRAFAIGVTNCGTGVGTVLFAPACQYLLTRTSWQNTQICLALIVLSAVLFGCLMRPLGIQAETRHLPGILRHDDHVHSDEIKKEERSRIQPESADSDTPTDDTSVQCASPLAMAFHDDESHFYIDKSRILPVESSSETIGTAIRYQNEPEASQKTISTSSDLPTKRTAVHVTFPDVKHSLARARQLLSRTRRHIIHIRPLNRPDIFYSGSINRHIRPPSALIPIQHVAIPMRDIMKRIRRLEKSWLRSLLKLFCGCKFSAIFRKMMRTALLKEDARFAIYVAGSLLCKLGFYIPYIYMVQFAMTSLRTSAGQSVTSDRAPLLISAIGASDIVGRLVFGLLGDRLVQDPRILGCTVSVLTLSNWSVALAGVTIVLMPLCTTFWQALLCSIGFGFFISGYSGMTSSILVEMLGLDRLTNALGVLYLFKGLASLLGTPLAGALFDETGSYLMIFAAAGGLLILSGILTSFIRLPSHTNQHKKQSEP